MPFSLKRLFLQTIGRIIPSDYFSHRFPVSVKGIFFINNKVVLLKNERDEWDLPGGKLSRRESFSDCLEREIKEELNIEIESKELIDITKVNILEKIDVIIPVYFCRTNAQYDDLKLSGENFDLGLFSSSQLPFQNLSEEYKELIKICFKKHTST